ncbi:TPA: hypothetical protein SMI10_004243 [Serratia liquefaciens]|nr:hypothetical protein [Serratia liquefaciens]HEJ7994488.1 hypothetical protein [Serratia liquefaciens]
MIKRFNPDFSLSISHELAYMRETPEGGYVAHGDYATLFSELEVVKAERDALLVENAALKGVVGEINEELYDKGFEVAGWHLNGDLEPLDNRFTDNGWGIPETPATDAALAAIEARGVEKAAAALDALSKLSASATSQANFRASAVYLRTEVLPGIGEAK